MSEQIPNQANTAGSAAPTPAPLEVTPEDIAQASSEVIMGAASAYRYNARKQLTGTTSPSEQKGFQRQINEATATEQALNLWEQSNDQREVSEDFGEFLDRTMSENENPLQSIKDAYNWVGSNSYNHLVSETYRTLWESPETSDQTPSINNVEQTQPEPISEAEKQAEKQRAVDKAREAVEQAHGVEVYDEVVRFAKGKTSIHTTDIRGQFADIGDSPSREEVGIPSNITQKEMGNNDWRQNLNESVMFRSVNEIDKRSVTKTRPVKGRFGRTSNEEYTEVEEVPGSTHPKLIHNEQTGRDEPTVRFLYQFQYSNSAEAAVSKGELPKITGYDYRSGNLLKVGLDLPKSIADKLASQIQQDPASLRSLIDRLVLENNNGGMTSDRWEGRDGRQPSRMPYDKLPKDWTIGLVNRDRATDSGYQITRLTV